MTDQNKKNVESGQQGTNEPWKEPGKFSNGRPRGTKNVVEKEVQKREANEKKADGSALSIHVNVPEALTVQALRHADLRREERGIFVRLAFAFEALNPADARSYRLHIR